MPLLTVTGGPIAPAGETLLAATLTVRYFSPYADGVNVYPTEYQAQLDGVSGGWKPLGAVDGTPFTVPGAGSGDPMPPECVLIERQAYASGPEVTFRYGPLRIYQTSVGEWVYGTPGAGIEFVVDSDLPVAGALLTSQLGVAGGVASLDGSGAVEQPFKNMAEGTAAGPGLAFGSDPDTGIYRDGANALGISAGGARRVRVNAAEPFLEIDDGADLQRVLHPGNFPVVYQGRDDNFSGTTYGMTYSLSTGVLYLFTLLLTTGSDSRSISAILTIGGNAAGQRTATVIAQNGFGTNRFSALSVTGTGVTVTTTTSLTYRARSGLFAIPAGVL